MPPFSGYAFLLFQDESSVQALIDACIQEDGKLYLCVSSPTIKDKPVSPVLCWNCVLSVLLEANANVQIHVQRSVFVSVRLVIASERVGSLALL